MNTNCYLGKHLGQPPPVNYKLDMWVYFEGLLLVIHCLKQVADPLVLFRAKHDGFISHSSNGFFFCIVFIIAEARATDGSALVLMLAAGVCGCQSWSVQHFVKD